MAHLKMLLLGSPHIELDGKALTMQTRKAMALLVYLAITQHTHTRDALATMLWPESTSSKARLSLRQTLWGLKKALGENWLVIKRESARLKPDAKVWIDVARFEQLVTAKKTHPYTEHQVCTVYAQDLEEAMTLYRGDFLTGFSLRNSPEFDDWQFYQSERLRGLANHSLERLVRHYSEHRRYEQAIEWAQRRLALEPLQEEAYRSLIKLHAWAGQRADALQQYGACVSMLEQELGVLPEKETVQLYEMVRGGRKPSPPTRSLEGYTHNLPEQATGFVGREEELAEIACLARDPGCRLVTLLGTGGVGKTRLVIEAATEQLEHFAQGVIFVPLAPLSSAKHIVLAIAEALHFKFQSKEDPQTQLSNYLREKELLLVLDNFEHVLEGAELLGEMLSSAPHLKILVTSRERLNLSWEWLLDVEGLQFPQDAQTEKAETYSAVQLFEQRARRVSPRFRLAAERRDVAHICRLVEGVPLAIELAAAQVREQGCARIAAQIAENLSILSTRLRDVPARHRSLRATFDHSWRLLTEEERRGFRWLSVFHGGFEAQAATQVTGASPRVLAVLVKKSLLRQSSTGRYEMLHVLRQYVSEKLAQNPEEEAKVLDRHSAYYADFLRQQAPALVGRGQSQALDAIGQNLENARMTWNWSVEHIQVDRIEACLDSLFYFYDIRSWYREGESAFAQAIAACEQTGQMDDLFWKLRARQSVFLYRLNYYDEAHEYLQDSLKPSHLTADAKEEAFCRIHLGNVLTHQGKYALARELYEQALDKARNTNAQYLEAESLRQLGVVIAYLGDLVTAKIHFEQALIIYRKIGNKEGEVAVLHNLGLVLALKGKYTEANAY